MIQRCFFALKQGFKERKKLKTFLNDPTKQITSLSEITAERLDNANIAILVLDFDGVLAPHGALEPLPEAAQWLRRLSMVVGETRIAILTNKPHPARLRYFSEHFPSIHVVQGVRKKPYPDGLLEVIAYRGVPPHRVMLLDDRLLTGMLATVLCCCQGWYFRHPISNYKASPIKEGFFSLLRVMERWVF